MSDPISVPDPSGPPEPIKAFPSWFNHTFGAVGTFIVSAGVFVTLITFGALTTRTAGSRASTRLKWKEQPSKTAEAAAPTPTANAENPARE